jgi:hypothetical protein
MRVWHSVAGMDYSLGAMSPVSVLLRLLGLAGTFLSGGFFLVMNDLSMFLSDEAGCIGSNEA